MNDLILPTDFGNDDLLFDFMHNEEKRKEAYVLFVGPKEMKPSDIALEISVPVNTIRRWVTAGKWNVRVREARQQRAEEEQVALELFRDDNRLEEVKDQLKAGKRGREIVMEMLESGEISSPGQLKQLGEALKSFSDVAARAVGLGETVEQKGSQADEAKAGRIRPPAVVIVAGPGSSVQVKEQPN